MPTTAHRRTIALGTGLIAAFLYANFLLDWVLRGFTGMGQVVSELESPGQPDATLLRVTDVVCAVLVVALLPWVRAALPAGAWREVTVWGTVVFAAGATVAAVVASPCGPDVGCTGAGAALRVAVHDACSIVSDTALYVGVGAAWLATRRAGPAWFHRAAWWVFWLGGVLASALFGAFDATQDPAWAVGASQRVHILAMSAWIVCLAVLAGGPRPAAAPRRDLARTRTTVSNSG